MFESHPLFPTSYFAPLPLMAAMLQKTNSREFGGTLHIEKCETFPKQTHRNRTVIITSNGPITLSVPVVRPHGTHSTTSEITVSYAEHWNIIHWRTIMTSYNSSPYFLYYRDELENILLKHYECLLELNQTILHFILKKMKSDCEIVYTEIFQKPGSTTNDYRERYDYKKKESTPYIPPYSQVFLDRQPFYPCVGCLDLLFNLGPQARDYLMKMDIQLQ